MLKKITLRSCVTAGRSRTCRDLHGARKKFERVSITRDICDACAKSCEISDDTEMRVRAECKNSGNVSKPLYRIATQRKNSRSASNAATSHITKPETNVPNVRTFDHVDIHVHGIAHEAGTNAEKGNTCIINNVHDACPAAVVLAHVQDESYRRVVDKYP